MFSCITGGEAVLIGGFSYRLLMLRPIRAALHDLYPFVHPKVVPVLPQFAPQRINRND